MLKMLRYDFYKIFKSKALLGVFIASVCLSIGDAIFVGFHYYDETCFLLRLKATLMVQFLPLIFVAPFVCKDFSSKFFKNVWSEYSLRDKIYYILSKVVYIFAINLIWYAVYFLSYYVFISLQCFIQHVPFVFEGVSLDGTVLVTASQGIFSYFCVIVNAFAVEMLVLFLSVLMKKEYIVLIVVILYWYGLSTFIYNALNKAIGPVYNIFHEFEWFTVFGMLSCLKNVTCTANTIVTAGLTQSLLVSLGYSFLFGFLSCLVVARKKDY